MVQEFTKKLSLPALGMEEDKEKTNNHKEVSFPPALAKEDDKERIKFKLRRPLPQPGAWKKIIRSYCRVSTNKEED